MCRGLFYILSPNKKQANNKMTKKSWSIDSLAIIFSIIVIAQLATYAIPQGEFERQEFGEGGALIVVAGSFDYSDAEEQVSLNPWHFLVAIPKGFAAAQNVIFLIFIAGGVIAILRKSGAIDAVLHKSVDKLGGSPGILIAGCLVLFGVGSYTIGMGEEYVPLIPIIVTMSLAMRMDAIVAMGMVWCVSGGGLSPSLSIRNSRTEKSGGKPGRTRRLQRWFRAAGGCGTYSIENPDTACVYCRDRVLRVGCYKVSVVYR
jgi:uncharacterized ion transporter superfamily protein YfcC